jgi:aldose sugar dehydrogenase
MEGSKVMQSQGGRERMPGGSWTGRGAIGLLAAGLLLLGAGFGIAPPLAAQAEEGVSAVVYSDHHRFRVITVAEGLENPWGIAFLPGGDILVTERAGRLRLIRDGALVPEPVGGIPEVRVGGQGGLLDVELHPQFEENRLVYLSYSKPLSEGRSTTAVVRGEFDGANLANVEEVIEAQAAASPGRHYGSRLAFDPGGYLYITIGDRGQQRLAQELSGHHGTTLRLRDDGSVPDDNPFVGQAGALPEIYTYGNRNAQGMAVHPGTGEIWQNEHGPRGGDELNRIRSGVNFGWPEITHGINYSGTVLTSDTARAGMEQPVHHWTPSIAVSGMDFYMGSAFPAWEGHAFVGALRQEHIQRLVIEGDRVLEREHLLFDLERRFREVATGPDGYLYLLTDHSEGEILRLEPTDDSH